MRREAEEPSGNWVPWRLFCLGYYDRKLEVGGQFVRSRKRVIENFGGGKSETSVLEDWVSD